MHPPTVQHQVGSVEAHYVVWLTPVVAQVCQAKTTAGCHMRALYSVDTVGTHVYPYETGLSHYA